jgi:transmembrane sensor
MALKKEDMDILLAKFVTGETNAKESAAAERWIGASEENRSHVDRLRRVWRESRELGFKGMADVDEAWEEFSRRAGAVRPAYRRIRWVAAAAVIILLVGIGLLIRRSGASDHGPAMVQVFSGNTERTDTLPDGSIVDLDVHSGLTYPAGFAGMQRNVSLTGGGFFMVAHDPRKPFSIAVDGISVRVLGTSFSIRRDSGLTEIAVVTGVVEVAGLRRSLKLYAHERLTVAQPDSGWIKKVDTVLPTVRDTIPPQMRDTPKMQKMPKVEMKADTDSPKMPKAAKMMKSQKMEDDIRRMKDTLSRDASFNGPNEYQRQLGIMKAIVNDVIARGIVSDRNSLIGVVLSETELVVNGVKQPDDVHWQFRDKYLDGSGNGYFYGTISVMGKGYFFNKDDFK